MKIAEALKLSWTTEFFSITWNLLTGLQRLQQSWLVGDYKLQTSINIVVVQVNSCLHVGLDGFNEFSIVYWLQIASCILHQLPWEWRTLIVLVFYYVIVCACVVMCGHVWICVFVSVDCRLGLS